MGGIKMSARQAKNVVANPINGIVTNIDETVKVAVEKATKINDDINTKVKEETNVDINVAVKDESNNDVVLDTNDNVDRIASLKAKMKSNKKKEVNKQVTVYLTPANYKRFNQLKEKGQKSELINQLLDLYFED